MPAIPPDMPMYRITGGSGVSPDGAVQYRRGLRYTMSLETVEQAVYQRGPYGITVQCWDGAQWVEQDLGQFRRGR